MLKVGDSVQVNHPSEPYHMEFGRIVQVDKHGPYTYCVRMKDGDFWFNEHELVSGSNSSNEDSVFDFDGGFGIGGLGRHIEEPIIPSVQALERHEQRLADAEVCRRCGCSELDGAMFTTMAGSGICDDCLDS